MWIIEKSLNEERKQHFNKTEMSRAMLKAHTVSLSMTDDCDYWEG